MLNVPKFSGDDRQKIFFVSDLHYHHEKLVKNRGFDNLDDYNREIICNWNNTLNSDSIVFSLGDLVLGAGEKSLEVFCNLLKILNYHTLYLMPGNHTAGIRRLFNENLKNKKIDEFFRLSIEGFTPKIVYVVPNYYEIFVGHQPIVLSHYPILSFNGQGKGAWHIYGHSHGNLKKEQWLKENYLQTKVFDVGLENTGFRFRPMSYDEIAKIMESKLDKTFDHH